MKPALEKPISLSGRYAIDPLAPAPYVGGADIDLARRALSPLAVNDDARLRAGAVIDAYERLRAGVKDLAVQHGVPGATGAYVPTIEETAQHISRVMQGWMARAGAQSGTPVQRIAAIRGELFELAHKLTSDLDRDLLACVLRDVSVALDANLEGKPPVIIPAVDRSKETTTDGRSVDEVRAEQGASTGMHTSYIVLSDEERAKGFVRPVRLSYVHVGRPKPEHPLRELTEKEHELYDSEGFVKFEQYPEGETVGRFWTQREIDGACGALTKMGRAIAETYARDPKYYGSTFCVACGKHFPVGKVGEFVWDDDRNARVGT